MLQQTLHSTDEQRFSAASSRADPPRSVISMLTDTTIQRLSLDYKRITYCEDEAEDLAPVLAENNTLKAITLHGCRSDNGVLLALISALCVNTSLTSIQCSLFRLNGQSISSLVRALYTNKTVKKLVLIKGPIYRSSTDADVIAELLRVNDVIETLALINIRMSCDGTQRIIKALQTNTSLTALNLNQNNVGAASAQALVLALQQNTTLRSIELRYNSLGDLGITKFAACLQTNPSLTAVDVRDNLFRHTRLEAIAQSLQSNDTLVTLQYTDFKGFRNHRRRISEMHSSIAHSLQRNRRRTLFIRSPHGLKNIILYRFFRASPSEADTSVALPPLVKLQLTECAIALRLLSHAILRNAAESGWCFNSLEEGWLSLEELRTLPRDADSYKVQFLRS
jgi:Leucine Rich repeat